MWGYTATGLVDEQIELRDEAERITSAGQPAHDVLSRLQDERRLTAAWQAARTSAARAALDSARSRTDIAVEEFRRTSPAGLDTTPLKNRAGELNKALDTLSERRTAIDDRTIGGDDAFAYFTDTVADATELITATTRTDDGSAAHAVAATVSLVHLTEMLSREDATLTGALPSGRVDDAARARFGQYLAVQRAVGAHLSTGDLPTSQAAAYARLTDSARWTSLASIEDAVAGNRGTQLPKSAAAWPEAADTVVDGLQKLNSDSLAHVAGTGTEQADDLVLGLVLGSLGTLAGLAIAAIPAWRVRRSVIDRLARLHEKTEDLAGTRLPELLSRLERGERVDTAEFLPHGPRAADELGRLEAAIEQMARVAVETVAHQSLGREGTEKVFAQLIRRTQILIHRLISLLDDLERKHEDSDLLKDIFKVDHLATRVRRHSENLVILGGSPPTRRMTAPVSITDVMRSAVAETEQYTRVKVKNLAPGRQVSLAGRAVADVTHLLAELIENGTSFSPPDTQVFVSATKVARGLALHVEDHGLGMPEEHRARANHLLAHPPKLDMMTLGEDPRLGHFVVARLAERHRIKVELRESVYGGTMAIVLVPTALLEEHDSPVLQQLKTAASAVERSSFAPPAVEPATFPSTAGEPGAFEPAAAETAPAGMAGGATGTPQPQPQSPLRIDQHGYPEYGGAGLLPPTSAHSAAQSPMPTPWSPPQEHPDPEAGQSLAAAYEESGAAGDERAPDQPRTLTTPRILPQRTKGASLAQQLRKEAAQAQAEERDDEEETGGLSPGESARTMMAIQQGMKRARITETDKSAGADGQADSYDRGAN
ncbi:nitrate- and nitrite sensing domain-containing protein [Streptomyces sp. ISL-10]|uniref:sensor histidine kinase n=1 Tax=Streptomyces sp. ISL-10 TaxID=2819172 RepID=UPI001BE8AD37|nr:nitrate- and nitrite sensing domain-containing protein [Streptomyces sp. ISL-10]MBT2365629.1 nitrate- and nitrite sensing domain-containing protein [Streptomyces sp. ISL-10]